MPNDRTLDEISGRLRQSAGGVMSLLRDPGYRAIYHAPEKRERVCVDLVLMSSDGLIVSSAYIGWDSGLLIPGWSPDASSDFAKGDYIREYWLVVDPCEEDQEPIWCALETSHEYFFQMRDPGDWERIRHLRPRAEDRTPYSNGTSLDAEHVDLEGWMRQASLGDLMAFADSNWGRNGVFTETRRAFAEYFQGPEGRIWREQKDPDEVITINSDPNRIMEWLYENRPKAFAVVVLIPYAAEVYRADVCVDMDPWLGRAIRVVRGGKCIEGEEERPIIEVAQDVLLELSMEEDETSEGETGNVTRLYPDP